MSTLQVTSSPSNRHFLSHIGGLRGVAILLVVLYHLNPEWCCHGYFGVDVFFVISGYLIYAGYLAKRETISFLPFLKARFTRLFPAVLFMVGVYHLLSALLLPPYEWFGYYSSSVAALLGYANMHFDELAKDYFAADAARQPLLHLWYLSVVLHFYLLFACIFLIFPGKFSLTTRWVILAVISLASFIMYRYYREIYEFLYSMQNIPFSQIPKNSYFWTTGRIWECVAGMLIVHIPQIQKNAYRTALTLVGICSIIIPSFIPILSTQQNLFAVLGTMLIIAYVPTGACAKILDNPVWQFIGKISFSLYLWHHIVFYFWKHFTCWGLTTWEQYLYMLSAAFMLSWLAWFIIEKRKFTFRTTLILWVLMLIVSHYTPFGVVAMNSIRQGCQPTSAYPPGAFAPQSLIGTAYEHLNNEAQFETWPSLSNPDKVKCLGQPDKTPTFLMMGDSHAHALFPGINRLAKETGFTGVAVNSRPLPFWKAIYNLPRSKQQQTMTEQVVHYLSSRPEFSTILVACRWDYEFRRSGQNAEQELRQFCEIIRAQNKKLVLFIDNPLLKESQIEWYITFCRIHGIAPRKEAIECTERQYFQENKHILCTLHKLEEEGLCHLIHTEQHLFENGVFKVLTDENTLLMYDTNHLTMDGVMLLCQHIKEQLIQLLK